MQSPAIKSHTRSKQILDLLKIHGPLSFRSLKAMMVPEMKERRLHDCLSRLVRRGLVNKRHERVFRGAGTFYQLAQDFKSRETIADLIACSAESLFQPQFRSRELLHAESCAQWAHFLRAQFPSVDIVRDFQFAESNKAKRVLLSDRPDAELAPDLLLIYRRENGSPTAVAIEIERSQKSNARLLTKLKKYANGSLVDGLIYICGSKRITEVLRLIYSTHVISKAHRVRQYGNNFVLFGNEEMPLIQYPQMYNVELENVSLTNWLAHLSATQRADRRDDKFKTSAVTC